MFRNVKTCRRLGAEVILIVSAGAQGSASKFGTERETSPRTRFAKPPRRPQGGGAEVSHANLQEMCISIGC